MTERLGRLGPLLLATWLALVSVPFVAATLVLDRPPFASVAAVVRAEDAVGAPHQAGPSVLQALAVALLSVLAAALAGGWEGGRARRHGRSWSVAAALVSAWAAGIVAVPLTAWLLHVPLDPTGACAVDLCPGWVVDPAPWSGLVAYGRSLAYGIIAWPAVAVGAIVTVGGRRAGSRLVTTAGAIATCGAVHGMSVLVAPVPFACLALGVLGWDALLARADAPRSPA